MAAKKTMARLVRRLEGGGDATQHVEELLAMLPLWRERWLLRAVPEEDADAYFEPEAGSSTNVGRDAARLLGRMKPPPLEALAGRLDAADAPTRAGAVHAFGLAAAAGWVVDAHEPRILERSGDESPVVRAQVAEYLLRWPTSRTPDVVASLLDSSDVRRQEVGLRTLIEALSRQDEDPDDDTSSPYERLAARVRELARTEGDPAVRRRARVVLVLLVPAEAEDSTELRDALASDAISESDRDGVYRGLVMAGLSACVPLDRLSALAGGQGRRPEVRERAGRALESLGRSEGAGARLAERVRSPDISVAISGIQAVEKLGDAAVDAMPALLARAAVASDPLETGARATLLAFSPRTRSRFEALLASGSADERRIVREILEDFDAWPERSWSDFVGTLPARFQRLARALEGRDMFRACTALEKEREDRETAAAILARATWERSLSEARLGVVRALAKLAPAGGEASIAACTRLLGDQWNPARAALEGLAAHGARARRALPRVVHLFERDDEQVLGSVEEALCAFGHDARDEIGALARSGPDWRREAALRVLEKIEEPSGLHVLLDRLERESGPSRAQAADQLWDRRVEAAHHADRLRAVLPRLDPETRGTILWLLHDVGAIVPGDLPLLVEALASKEYRLVASSAAGIVSLGPSAAPFAEDIARALGRSARIERDTLFWSWGDLVGVVASVGAPCVPHVSELLDDREPKVRALAAWALGAIGPAASSALEKLESMASRAPDRSPELWHSTEAIVRIAGYRPSAERGIASSLREPATSTTLVSLRLLADAGPRADALVEAVEVAIANAGERSPAFVAWGLVALDSMGSRATAALERAAHDVASSPSLGWLARRIAGRRGFELRVAATAPVATPLSDEEATRVRRDLLSKDLGRRLAALATIRERRDAPEPLDDLLALLDEEEFEDDDHELQDEPWSAIEALGPRGAGLAEALARRAGERDEWGAPRSFDLGALAAIDAAGTHCLPLLRRAVEDPEASAHERLIAARELVRRGEAARLAPHLLAALERTFASSTGFVEREELVLLLAAAGAGADALRVVSEAQRRGRHVDSTTQALVALLGCLP